ncbi:hypothetical protein EJB05_32997, partial [Eragrostis curvula]
SSGGPFLFHTAARRGSLRCEGEGDGRGGEGDSGTVVQPEIRAVPSLGGGGLAPLQCRSTRPSASGSAAPIGPGPIQMIYQSAYIQYRSTGSRQGRHVSPKCTAWPR